MEIHQSTAPICPANETASQGPYAACQRDCVSSFAQASCKEVPTVRQDDKEKEKQMQDATTRIELHSPHSGGNLPTITREPTGHDEPPGARKDAPQVAEVQPPLPLNGPRAKPRTFLPQRGVYYAAIAGVIAGVVTALLTIVVTLVFAGTFHAASQQIAVDRLT